MKTYKQMAENVLKRRDEYFEQKQDRKASRGVISAAVAACAVVVVILFGTIIGGVMKSPVTTPETDAPPSASSPGSTEITAEETETKPEDTDDTEREATAEITEETTEEDTETETDTETDTEQSNEQNDIYIRPVDYIPEPNAPITVNMGIDGVMYGYECREVMTYTFKYNFYKYKEKIGDLHGQHVRVIVTHNDRIELISPEIFTLDIPDGTATFNIEFRYKDEATNGKFVMYFIEDLYEDIDKYNSVDYVEQIKNEYSFRSVSQLLECCAARTKGYDFFKAGTSSNNRMYGSIAHHFGDVDENGVPLYRYDPYMPDYYDCDECISKRKQIERDLKNKEEFFSTYEEFFSTYNSMSRDNNIYRRIY